MTFYPVRLQDDGDLLLVTSPDFPELTTFGADIFDAIARAGDALEEAIAARVDCGEDVPAPLEGLEDDLAFSECLDVFYVEVSASGS